MLFSVDKEQGKPLQEQIFEQILKQIVSGALRPGMRLPSSRALSQMLGVSRNTVAFAYGRLRAEGYLTARRGARTCIVQVLPDRLLSVGAVAPRRAADGHLLDPAGPLPPPAAVRQPVVFHAARAPIDFWVPQADPHAFPLKTWKRLVAECLSRAGSNLADYGDPSGLEELRRAIAEQVARSRGIAATPDAVFIMAGAQLAMNIVARLFLRGGERVLVENPRNQGAAYLFESYGARLMPMPLDHDGLITSELPSGPVSLAYVMPSHQFPLGVQLALDRRHALLDWAEAVGVYVVEDDYDGHFFYTGPNLPALKALRSDQVIYLGTFSKTLGAGLRIGYAIFPPALIERARAARALIDNGQAWLEQAVLAKFIRRGGFDKHLRLIRKVYLARRDRLIAELQQHFGQVALAGTQSGTHLAWHLPDHLPPAPEVQSLARRHRVGVYTIEAAGGHEFGGDRIGRRTLLMGYGHLTEREIAEGIDRLAGALAGRDVAVRAAVPMRELAP